MKFLKCDLPTFSFDSVKTIANELYGFEGDFSPLGGERDQNFRVRTERGDFVFKIANVDESLGVIDFQTQALRHLAQTAPNLAVPRIVPTVTGEATGSARAENGRQHIVRALSWVPGNLVADTETSPALRRSIGRTMAQLDIGLRGFFHPSARHELLWDVTQCAPLRPYIEHIGDRSTQKLVGEILDHLLAVALPAAKSLRHQVIHADAHRANVLVDPSDATQVAGLLDFGDMVYAPLIQELSVAADLRGVASGALLDRICAMVAAYDELLPLDSAEIDLLYDFMIGRMAISSIIVATRNAAPQHHTQTPAYNVEEEIWQTLADIAAIGRQQTTTALRKACRFPTTMVPSTASLIASRKAALGENLRHFYTTPIHLERGEGIWLYGSDGKRYLDCYNNVPVVGHCHPHVVNAVSRQLATLNTHTRYLYNVIVEYAERLTAMLPDHLTVASFVNSGSEANDIAWRMAKHATGNGGGLVVEAAYHGITDAISAFTPSRKKLSKAPFIRTLEAPDLYRGRFRAGEPDLAALYAADADRAIGELDAVGLGTACFMLDSLFVSNGSPEVPQGYVAAVVDKVRAAGGLFIADEVQAGFARSGRHFWGHELWGVSADIVTMGKPIGNGFPLGVVVTTPDILNRFVSEVGLFSTFGGNPVACAAGLAVLDVIEAEGLQENALTTGNYLRDGIRDLMTRHPIIGDVRGNGLMVGVELVRDRDTREPATAETKKLLDIARDAGVLFSNGGLFRNVLKIRPPLVFRQQHADILIATLDQCLGQGNRILF